MNGQETRSQSGGADIRSRDKFGAALLETHFPSAEPLHWSAMLHSPSGRGILDSLRPATLRRKIAFCRRIRHALDQQPRKDRSLRVHPSSSRRTASPGPCLSHGPCAFSSDSPGRQSAGKNRRLQAGEFPTLVRIIFDRVHAHRRISDGRSLHPISRLAGDLSRWKYKCSRDCLIRPRQSLCRHD